MNRRNIRIAAALAATGFACLASVSASEVPKRKPGLWQISTSSANMPGGSVTTKQCIDAHTDDLARQTHASGPRSHCSTPSVKAEGGRVVVDSVCRYGSTSASTHAVFSGNFDSDYRGDITTKYNPPLMGHAQSKVTVQARWLGPCLAGQQPGDIILPNGRTINPAHMPKYPSMH